MASAEIAALPCRFEGTGNQIVLCQLRDKRR